MGRERLVYDKRFNPFSEELMDTEITNESHTVAQSGLGFYGVRLKEVPLKESPSSISISGFTEIESGDPEEDQFVVDYKYQTGWLMFNAANNGDNIIVSYKGIGSPNEAALYNDHRLKTVMDHPNGSVTTDKLANNSVTLAKIPDQTIGAIRNSSTQPLKIQILSSDPTSPEEGQIWIRSDL